MVFCMERVNSSGLMEPDIKVSSETTKLLGMEGMNGQIKATMRVKFLTDSDMEKELTRILKKV